MLKKATSSLKLMMVSLALVQTSKVKTMMMKLIQAVKKLLKVKNPRLQLQILLQKIILQRVE